MASAGQSLAEAFVATHAVAWLHDANADRIAHFRQRAVERGLAPNDLVIVLLHVDDPTGVGGAIADALMPSTDWQAYRDRGEAPIARGLAKREGIQEALEALASPAAERLRRFDGLAVVAIDKGVAAVF